MKKMILILISLILVIPIYAEKKDKKELPEEASEKVQSKGKILGPNIILKDDKLIIGNRIIKFDKLDNKYYISNNKKYIAVKSVIRTKSITLYDNEGNILWERKYKKPLIFINKILVSDFGYSAVFYGEVRVSGFEIIGPKGKTIKKLWGRKNSISGEEILSITAKNAHFAKYSSILVIAIVTGEYKLGRYHYNKPRLIGIDEFGGIVFNQNFNSTIKGFRHHWYAKGFFNKRENKILINNNCIGEKIPSLTYWDIKENKKIFEKKVNPGEGIIDAAFTEDGDILLLKAIKNKRFIQRLDSEGKEKGNKKIEKLLKSIKIQTFEVDKKGNIKINGKVILNKDEIK